MRDIGDEVAADLIGAIESGDVAGHHEGLGISEGHHVDVEKALGVHRRGQFQAAQLAALLVALEQLVEGRLADQVGDPLARVLGPAHAEVLRGGIVGPLDVVIGTEHQRGVAQRGGGLPEPLEVGGELLLAPLLAVTQPVDAAAHLFEDPG